MSTKIIRGVKQKPQPTNSERLQQHDVELKNLQVSVRMSQMMVKQMVQSFQELSQDLGKAFGLVNELQYKVLAMQSLGNFDPATLGKHVDELRLKDWTEASDAEDKAGNFAAATTVQEDSTVHITSTTAGGEVGIFRSRIKLSECGVPALIEGFMGKQVGTKVTCQLNGVEHTVELLAVRNPPAASEVK
jgi:hypothetical protein